MTEPSNVVGPTAAQSRPASPRRGAGAYRAWNWARRILLLAWLAVASLGIVGQAVRDRSAAWGVLFYIPLPIVGLSAVALDALLLGRAVRRGRFALAVIGLALALVSSWPMWGWGNGSQTSPQVAVRLLQWNIRWGGQDDPASDPKQAIFARIVGEKPDIVVLSESPNSDWMEELATRLGPGWNFSKCAFPSKSEEYRCRFALLARGEISIENRSEIQNGRLVRAAVRIDGKPIRLLLVDGRSELRIWRTPLLREVQAQVEAAAARAEPIDVIAGDFNSVSRSRGFDSFAEMAGGFQLAARQSRGWRGTFPIWLPMYDIDHVWLRRDWPITHAKIFTDFSSDHRGQVVDFMPGGTNPN